MKIIAFVGMPGSGKTVAADVARKLGFPVIRLGDLTDEELKKQGLERNETNERAMREGLRKDFGMDIYARRAAEKAERLGKEVIILDGVKSFEELQFLRRKYEKNFMALCIAVSPKTRHERLGKRKERPLTEEECESRDESELKNLNEGTTIAMADYFIVNENCTKSDFEGEMERILRKFSQQKV